MSGAEFLDFTFNGVVIGSILTLAAVGLTLVYGILNLSNFAHGDFLTLGAYFALMFVAYGERHPLAEEALPPGAWAIGLAVLLVGVVAVDAAWWKRLRVSERGAIAATAAALLVALAGAGWGFSAPPAVRFGMPLVLGATALGVYVSDPGDRSRRLVAAGGLGAAVALGLFLSASSMVLATVLAIVLAVAFGMGLEVSLWRPLRDGILGDATFLLFGGLFGGLVWQFFITQAPGLGAPGVKWFALAALVAAGAGGLRLLLGKRRHIGRATVVTYIIVTIGLALALRSAIALRFGSGFMRFPGPIERAEPLVFGITATRAEITIVVVAAVAITLVHVLLRYTKVGKAMRALSDNMALARVSGIDVDRVILYVWGLAMGLTALAGVLFAQKSTVNPELGWSLLLYMFASVILGGIGSAYGAMAGGFAIGLATEWTAMVAPEYKFAVAFLILIVVLLFRPQGILGERIR